jgi:uncharacterized protein (UPF0335 family)
MAKLKTESAEPKTAGDLRPGGNALMQLLSFVERFERLQEERDALGDDQKEIMAEAKGTGFDTAIIRKIISRRKKDAADIQEADAMLELYEDSIKQAEKQQLAKSLDEGSGPEPAPAPRRGWAAPRPPVTEPDDEEVEANAAAEIAHAADHPED